VFKQGVEFSGLEAGVKLDRVREWVKAQPPATLSYSRSPPTASQMHVATLISSLSNIGEFLFTHIY
jgi:Xaa-Pro aminopeptidase